MQVINSSKITKNLKIRGLVLSFPPGLSEQPENDNILKYITSNRDLSIFKKKVKVPEPVKKKQDPEPAEEDESKKSGSKKGRKRGKSESKE